MENSPSRPQSARGIPAASRSSSAPRCPSSQRGSSLPREPTGDVGRGPPQRAASSIDCSSFDRGNGPVPPHNLPGRTAYTRNILGGSPVPQGPPSSFGPGAGIEDLGYKVSPGQFQASLVQTVESLLQSKLSQAPNNSQRRASKVSGSEGSLQRDLSLPTMVDDLVLYTEPQDEHDQRPGLGSVQLKGRAEVMQQWLRPDLPQANLRSERRDPLPRALQLRNSAQAQDAEMEWSTLSDASRQAIRQWVAGQLGGRHCMLVLEQGCAETAVPPTSETSMLPDLRGGAVLNVLLGLFAEGGLLNPQGLGSWLFQAVFSKHPQQVLEEALEQCILEIGDPRLERLTDISPEQVNLALRRLLLKAQFRSCGTLGLAGSQDECTKLQVWLELARLHVEGWPGIAGAPPSKERPQRPSTDKAFGDGGVLKELGKQEIELEAESQQMSLETLRAQNRLIEEYVMRLVRQRDELKQVTKLAEERDSYYILGLSGPSASEEEVKKAYRNLARREHPDKAGIGNKKRFQAIQHAYTSILKKRQLGGPAVPEEEVRDEAPKEVVSTLLNESYGYGMQAQEAADSVAVGAHRAMRAWEDSEGKRRSLRGLRELTRQSAVELRGLGQQLRSLGRATVATVRCAEAFLSDNNDIADTLSTGMALRDRCAIVEDAGNACATSAELLERISEATEATLKKVEKAAPDANDGNNLQRLGTRLLTESLARSSSVARRTAEEAISCARKTLDLHKGLMMLDAEARKERERLRKRQQCPEDEPMPAADAERPTEKPSTGQKETKDAKKPEEVPRTPRSRPITPLALQTPRDQLKSAAKRVKERHVSLRVKNLRFLASLNEEALRTQARLFALLERSEGALIPEISVSQKGVIFDLVAQLLDFALAEAGKLAGNLANAPARILERVMSFALALEHGKELAMPVDSRTQALKLASLIDTQLLCQVVTGPFRRRLLALARKRCEGGYANRRSSSGSMKAWEEAANACCERIACCIQQAVMQNGSETQGQATS